MKNNEELYKDALEAINNLFADKSVSVESAISNLENLRDEIDLLIDSLGG